MTDEVMRAAIEAQFCMGHVGASIHTSMDRTTVENYSWDVDQVRQALHVPLTPLWEERVFDCELQGLASFCFNVAPYFYDNDRVEHEIPGWRDEPRDNWGSLSIHPAGILRLATLYGRPYVRLHESHALIEHWKLVCDESEARTKAPLDEGKWQREWPERYAAWKARLAELESGDE
jgi:hypothetical protein